MYILRQKSLEELYEVEKNLTMLIDYNEKPKEKTKKE